MSGAAAQPSQTTGPDWRPVARYFHVHLVSDSTGETLNALLKAVSAQFAGARPLEHVFALVRSRPQMQRVLTEIEGAPGLVLYTVVNEELRRMLEARCAQLQMPAISVLDPFVAAFGAFLGLAQSPRTGAQHDMDEAYFARIEAVDYTLAHDDGQMTWDLEAADVVIVGVSRTSKTPTSLYLANRGVKVANIPLVPGRPPPPELFSLQKPLVVGLVASPERLTQIRESRLREIGAAAAVAGYSELDAVRREVVEARRLFASRRWPTIDVTRKSVEETAAAILSKLSASRNAAAGLAGNASP